MSSDDSSVARRMTAHGILSRLLHLFSAQFLEGALHFCFFIYLASLDSVVYGELAYAMAAGSIIMKLVEFGLYFPLVSYLGGAKKEEAPSFISQAYAIKLVLFVLCMVGVWFVASYRGFSPRMMWILFFVSAGWAVEVLADTFFADMRVRGYQKKEAAIRNAASITSYVYGIASAAAGVHPVIVSLFKLLSGLARLVLGLRACYLAYGSRLFVLPRWDGVSRIFCAALVFGLIEILGEIYNKANIFFLERAAGAKGVGYYNATHSIIEGVSILVSQQLLAWVVFPLLSVLWWEKREQVAPFVSSMAKWLLAIALPIMFAFHVGSDLVIGLLYTDEFKDAAWMQRYLVWNIVFSFETNLFAYLMMVAGAARVLLLFAAIGTIANLAMGYWLVDHYNLAGACLTLVFTKAIMNVQIVSYCQIRFRLLKIRDFSFVACLALISLGIFMLTKLFIGPYPAATVTVLIYAAVLWRWGNRFMGKLDRRSDAETM